MDFLPQLLRLLDVFAVALVVAASDDVCGDRSAAILREGRLDMVAGGPLRLFDAALDKPLHVLRVGLKDFRVVGLGESRCRQPEDVFDRILDPDSPDVHPFGRGRHLRRVVPEELLAEIEAHVVAKGEQQPVVIERPQRSPGRPRPTDVEDETAFRLQDSPNLAGERQEPRNILLLVGVAVLFLEVERVGRRCNHQVNLAVRHPPHEFQTIGAIGLP